MNTADSKTHPTPDEQVGEWRGFAAHHLHVDGYEAVVVVPKNPAPGRPWIWRTEFFGAFAAVDEACVRAGYHLCNIAIHDRFGCPSAVETMTRFHDEIVTEFSLASRCVLFGFSRGALYALSYAEENPTHVAGIYLDAPVIDLQSWPGGKGSGAGSPRDWQLAKTIFALQEDADTLTPMLQKLRQLAERGTPLILVAGGSDTLVPFSENGAHLEAIWKESGAPFAQIVKPEVDHHPHSLEDPTPIVDFILQYMGK